MENKRNNTITPPYFIRPENAGAALLFFVLALCLPGNSAALKKTALSEVTNVAANVRTSVNNSMVNLHWTAQSGAVYKVQYSTNLLEGGANLIGGGWSGLDDLTSSEGGAVSFTDQLGEESARFYRVLLADGGTQNPLFLPGNQAIAGDTSYIAFRFTSVLDFDTVLSWSAKRNRAEDSPRAVPGQDIGLEVIQGPEVVEGSEIPNANLNRSRHFAIFRLEGGLTDGVWRVQVRLERSEAGADQEIRFLYSTTDGKLRETEGEYDAYAATSTDTAVWFMPASTTFSLRFGGSGLGLEDAESQGSSIGGRAFAGTHIGFTYQGEAAWIERLHVRLTRVSD